MDLRAPWGMGLGFCMEAVRAWAVRGGIGMAGGGDSWDSAWGRSGLEGCPRRNWEGLGGIGRAGGGDRVARA